jgi:hypothetical protein
MAVDRIKHTKPASERTFLDELEPIPYEITEEELAVMDPRMKRILFGIEEPSGPSPTQSPAARGETPDVLQITRITIEEKHVERFDPRSIADFAPVEGFNLTIIFPAAGGDERAEELARSAPEHVEVEKEGRRWHAARFRKEHALELKALDEALDPKRDDVSVLVNGKLAPYGRSLWLRMMYIFTAGKTVME